MYIQARKNINKNTKKVTSEGKLVTNEKRGNVRSRHKSLLASFASTYWTSSSNLYSGNEDNPLYLVDVIWSNRILTLEQRVNRNCDLELRAV